MTYLSKFDEKGVRISSWPVDGSLTEEKRNELEADGYVEISEEDWHYYVGNRGNGDNGTGYIRDAVTGKPISAPKHVIPLNTFKEIKIQEFKNIRNEKEIEPIQYNDNTFDFDQVSIIRMDAARKLLEDDDNINSIEWTTATNTRVTLTVEDFVNINKAGAIRSDSLHTTYNNLKAQINAATTNEQIESIVWPE